MKKKQPSGFGSATNHLNRSACRYDDKWNSILKFHKGFDYYYNNNNNNNNIVGNRQRRINEVCINICMCHFRNSRKFCIIPIENQ